MTANSNSAAIGKRILVLLLIVGGMLHELLAQDPSLYRQDFSIWAWFRINTAITHNSYASFQYQVRANRQASAFQASNIYFLAGYNPKRYLNIEVLYQLNTNHRRDISTFFTGLTYKYYYRKFTFYFRTAYQHSRWNFSGNFEGDRPVNEWRNRVRAKYAAHKIVDVMLSAEPVVNISNRRGVILDRIRMGAQASFHYNKYHTFNLFYLSQPDMVFFKRPNYMHVLGFTYEMELPHAPSKYKHWWKPKKVTNKQEKIIPKADY